MNILPRPRLASGVQATYEAVYRGERWFNRHALVRSKVNVREIGRDTVARFRSDGQRNRFVERVDHGKFFGNISDVNRIEPACSQVMDIDPLLGIVLDQGFFHREVFLSEKRGYDRNGFQDAVPQEEGPLMSANLPVVRIVFFQRFTGDPLAP